MKLCKDCKWCKPQFGDTWRYSVCTSPKAPVEINLVSGLKKALVACEVHRAAKHSKNLCGSNAAWFEKGHWFERRNAAK